MSTTTAALTSKRCVPCEGGVPKLSPAEAQEHLQAVPGWELTAENRLRRQWRMKDFLSGIDFFDRVAKLAEDEGHHPDLHLFGYKNVVIEIWTHAINGLSENDFILAAKIDQLPVDAKK